MTTANVRTNFLLLWTILLFTAGCATVDFDYPKVPSTALEDFEGTYLDGITDPYEEAHPGKSGFHLQTDGIDALAARLLIAQRAQKTIDAQYYLITDDSIGYVFIASLLQAADRGVRVRLLLDDIQTQGYDTGMAALDSHPNFEVRIFNPFARRSFRAGDAFGFSRLNRRMHNKAFIVDNQITIIGGRNIADEYFGAKGDVNFGDVDVLAVGPVVQDVSGMFDTYWNHESAAAIPAFAKMPQDPDAALDNLRLRIDEEMVKIRDTQYAEAVVEDYETYLQATMDIFIWADYKLAWDSPDKVYKKVAREGELRTITSDLRAAIEGAEEELVIISPYFVPRKRGVDYLRSLRNQGLDITIITNSLSATNHTIVHSGYAPSRKPLLEMGVKIREVRFDAGLDGIQRGGTGAELATLHTKAFVVDCAQLFVGSFNWDPRSLNINTESGVIIDSPMMGRGVCERLDEALDEKTFEVTLNEKGKLRWVDRSGDEPLILKKEPDTGWWTRLKVNFQKLLPIKSQL